MHFGRGQLPQLVVALSIRLLFRCCQLWPEKISRVKWGPFPDGLLTFVLSLRRDEFDLDEIDAKRADLFGNADGAAFRQRR